MGFSNEKLIYWRRIYKLPERWKKCVTTITMANTLNEIFFTFPLKPNILFAAKKKSAHFIPVHPVKAIKNLNRI